MLYLRDVGSVEEIVFLKAEFLVWDICRHEQRWSLWSKTLIDRCIYIYIWTVLD